MGPRFLVRSAVPVCALLLAGGLFVQPARASAFDESAVDATTLTGLETRAAAAEPRERCYLYTELLHGWTELASREMASGDDDAARSAVQRADADAEKLKSALGKDSKRLKNAELILEHTVHRLSDMMRVTSMEQRDAMQAVLRHMSSVHEDLLAAVFAH